MNGDMKTPPEIILELGGITGLARKLGVPVTTVSAWKGRGRIPIRYWPRISALHGGNATMAELTLSHTQAFERADQCHVG